MMSVNPVAVIETHEFIAITRKMFTDDDRDDLVSYLAFNPMAGDVIAGTGGVRKLRWSLAGRGKSGGARVIYYYHDERIPLHLLTAYAKNEQVNVSHAARNAFKTMVAVISAKVKESNS